MHQGSERTVVCDGRSGSAALKLEAYHQSRQPHSFSLFPLMFWGFGSLYQGVAASWKPSVAAADKSLYVQTGSVQVVQGVCCTLRRPSGQLLRQRHSVSVWTLRRPRCRLLRQRPTQQCRRCGATACLQLRRSSRSVWACLEDLCRVVYTLEKFSQNAEGSSNGSRRVADEGVDVYRDRRFPFPLKVAFTDLLNIFQT